VQEEGWVGDVDERDLETQRNDRKQKAYRHGERIEMAVVGAHRWEEVVDIVTAGAAVLQSETRYFESSEIQHAWQWARSAKHAEDAPVRIISPATGIWKDYRPEFMGV